MVRSLEGIVGYDFKTCFLSHDFLTVCLPEQLDVFATERQYFIQILLRMVLEFRKTRTDVLGNVFIFAADSQKVFFMVAKVEVGGATYHVILLVG